MEWKIESGIAPPEPRTPRPKRKYPWEEMEPGQSVVAKGAHNKDGTQAARAIQNAKSWCKRHSPDWEVAYAPHGEDTRIWLLEKKKKSPGRPPKRRPRSADAPEPATAG